MFFISLFFSNLTSRLHLSRGWRWTQIYQDFTVGTKPPALCHQTDSSHQLLATHFHPEPSHVVVFFLNALEPWASLGDVQKRETGTFSADAQITRCQLSVPKTGGVKKTPGLYKNASVVCKISSFVKLSSLHDN